MPDVSMTGDGVIIRCKGLLFDMDGVLISSIASADRCWVNWARHYGVANADSFRIKHGTRAVEIMKTARPDFTEAQLAEGLMLIEDMEIADVADLKVLPGVREMLGMLPKERWTIVTSATRRLLLGRLKAAGLPYPEELITANEVVNGKPHPEPYMKGAALLGFAPAECVVVEDAPSGVGAGVAAGSPVLGVLGTHSAEQLYGAGAQWVVRDLAGVKVTTGDGGLGLEFEAI